MRGQGKMNLRERIGSLFMVGFDGTEVPDSLTELIRDFHVGGVILFKRNITSKNQLKKLKNLKLHNQQDLEHYLCQHNQHQFKEQWLFSIIHIKRNNPLSLMIVLKILGNTMNREILKNLVNGLKMSTEIGMFGIQQLEIGNIMIRMLLPSNLNLCF